MKKKVAQKSIKRPKAMTVWSVFLLIFIAGLLFYAWCSVQSVKIRYEISREAENHRNLIVLQNSLKVELAHLKSPQRLAEIAERQIGLTVPAPEQIVVIP